MNHINDREIFSLIQKEEHRQKTTINLIASENYVSPEVLSAMGSVLTNKYAEGYPGKRYYSGCEFVDQVELIAQERCKKLFQNVEHVNVQPHAGSSANMAVYFTLLQPGDTIMGMSLAEGGHLTHGHSVSFSGKIYKSVQYTLNPQTQELDYDDIEKKAHQFRPKLIVCGASAYSRTIDFKRFSQIARSVNAYLLADIAHIAGLVAVGLHPSPVGYADFISSTTHKTLRGPRGGLIMCNKQWAEQLDKTIMPGMQGGPFMHIIAAKAVAFGQALEESFKEYQQQVIANAKSMVKALQTLDYTIVANGTDNHLFIIDLRNKGIRGNEAQIALEKAGITVSKSCIPFDPEKPWITSGIRLGSPALTTRGLKEADMAIVIDFIHEALQNHSSDKILTDIKEKVAEWIGVKPLYE